MRVSQSRLTTWMQCPLQAHFKYSLDLPTRQSGKASFGVVIHDALDFYNQTRDIEGAIKRFKHFWLHPEELDVEPEYWPRYTTFGGLMARGVEILEAYHDKLKWENRTVVATEHQFLVPFGDHEIHGFVDLLELKRSAKGKEVLRVVDYKTNSKAPFTAGLRVNIQFTAYVYASLQPEFWMGNGPDFPGLPDGARLYAELEDVDRRGIWYHLMTNKEYDAGPRDDRDFMRMYRVIHEIQRAEELDVYVPNISGETCTYCDFTEPCGIPYIREKEEDD